MMSDIEKVLKERISAFEKCSEGKFPKMPRCFYYINYSLIIAGEHRGFRSNERLEFLGDSVLSHFQLHTSFLVITLS